MKRQNTRLTKLPMVLGLSCVMLMNAACGANDETNVTYVVITSSPALIAAQFVPTFTPFPTFTPPPPPTATPEIAPDVALRMGERYVLDGYYEEAISLYNGILGRNDFPVEMRAAAAFSKGQAALRAGLFIDAVDAFTLLITAFSDDTRAHQAYFLRADAYLGLSRWTEAINDYRQYLRLRPGLIDSYVHERIGDAFLAIGMLPDALTSYQQATDANRGLEASLALRERVAQVYLSGGDVTNAVAQYDAILALAQNAPYRARIDVQAAQALIDAGELDRGLSRMQRVFNSYPEQPAALDAMRALDANGRPLNALERGRILFNQGDYQGAIVAFNDFSTDVPTSEIPAEMYLLMGRAYREVGNAPAAQVAFRTVVDQYPTDPLFGEALLEQGRTRFLLGDIPDAINFYLQIAQTHPTLTATAAEALWRAGYLHGTNEQYAESRQIFTELATKYPNTEQARSGLSIAAAAAANLGDNAGAEALFNQLAATSSGDQQAEAWLEAGRLALLRGDNTTAHSAFQKAGSAAPDTYFSARSADIMAGIAPFTPPVAYQFEGDEEALRLEAETWLRQTFAVTQEGELWPLSDALRADARLIRGTELWVMNAFEAAENEFYEVLDAYETDGLASYQMALYFRGLGAYVPSQQGAANIIMTAQVSNYDAPRYIARLRFPAYYRDVLLDVAAKHNVDPLLFYALIRQESLFDPNATAGAGEKGLMQVIPDTAAYIAQQLSWPNYENTDLFRPYVAIEFGGFYLEEQMSRFDGNVYAALAGYNAGPGRAIDWLQLAGSDPDLFMNTITIDTTQHYIQLIYRNYNIYRALYGA